MTVIKPFVPQAAEHYQINDLPWNDLIDYVMPVLKPNSWKVLCFILRKTLGWNKEADKLSYSQIISGITGKKSSDQTISSALSELIEKGYILVINPGKEKSTLTYAPNPDFEIVSATEIVADTNATTTEIEAEQKQSATKIVTGDNKTATEIVADGKGGNESATKIVDTKDSLNPIESNRVTDSSPIGEGGKPQPPPVEKLEQVESEPEKPIPKTEYTPFLRGFLARFNAKRFKNGTQYQTICDLTAKHGETEMDNLAEWAANKGMGLGQAIPAIKSVLGKKGHSANGHHQRDQRGAGQNQSEPADGATEVQRGIAAAFKSIARTSSG